MSGTPGVAHFLNVLDAVSTVGGENVTEQSSSVLSNKSLEHAWAIPEPFGETSKKVKKSQKCDPRILVLFSSKKVEKKYARAEIPADKGGRYWSHFLTPGNPGPTTGIWLKMVSNALRCFQRYFKISRRTQRETRLVYGISPSTLKNPISPKNLTSPLENKKSNKRRS